MAKKLKLFVWEDVLQDYGSGIMFALAYNKEEAKQLILSKFGYDSVTGKSDLEKEPRVIEQPEGFYIWGSS